MNPGELDLYSLFNPDEAQARMQAQALSAALRKQQQDAGASRAIGNLGLLTGDKVLGQFGQAQLQNANQAQDVAQQQQGMLANAGAGRLRMTMDKLRQDEQLKAHAREGLLNRAGEMDRLKLELGLKEQLANLKQQGDKADQGQKTGMDLRKEYDQLPEVKQFKDVTVAYNKIKNAVASPSAAGDLSAIFSYMKILDPGSSVREGEFANAQNATGVPGKIMNAYNNALRGERLSPEQRSDFLSQAANLYKAHQSQVGPVTERYAGLASKYGVDPGDVVAGTTAVDQGASQSATATAGKPPLVMVQGRKFRLQEDGTYLPE